MSDRVPRGGPCRDCGRSTSTLSRGGYCNRCRPLHECIVCRKVIRERLDACMCPGCHRARLNIIKAHAADPGRRPDPETLAQRLQWFAACAERGKSLFPVPFDLNDPNQISRAFADA